jgi:hypothetical protein
MCSFGVGRLIHNLPYGNAAKLSQILIKYDKIWAKYAKNNKMHVENFQERHFLKEKSPCGNANNIAKGLGWWGGVGYRGGIGV